MSWLYKGKVLESEDIPEGAYGFVYIIVYTGNGVENLSQGKFYIGKKALTHRTKRRLGKKARKVTRKRIQRGTKGSGWEKYWSSCLPLKEDVKRYGEENFRREILEFTFNKAENTYVEIEQQIVKKVLFRDSWNNWISGKVWRSQLNLER